MNTSLVSGSYLAVLACRNSEATMQSRENNVVKVEDADLHPRTPIEPEPWACQPRAPAFFTGPSHTPSAHSPPSGAQERTATASQTPPMPAGGAGFEAADPTLRKMRRVDWRWAAAKGFLDKETNQWNEAMGGLDGYLRQRTERVLARCALLATCAHQNKHERTHKERA